MKLILAVLFFLAVGIFMASRKQAKYAELF